MSVLDVPGNHQDQKLEASPQSTTTSNWTINVSDIRTVKVNNISLIASEGDIKEFFSFSGDVRYIEMHRETERSQMAYVTFKEAQGAETAVLLSGATIAELSVTIMPVEDYHLPPGVLSPSSPIKPPGSDSVVKKAEDVVSTMLAKGFVLGKDAFHKAKDFDERHQFISNASATVASLDQKIGLSEKLIIGTTVVNEKVKEVNERFQVSEKTRSALAVAEQTASSASSALMSNRFVSTGASWVTGAYNIVAKAAGDVSVLTKEKVEKAEEDKKDVIYKERTGIINDFAEMHLDESSMEEHPVVPISSHEESKIGLI